MWALLLALLTPVYAQDEALLSKLLAPGPLMEAHKKFEGKDCLKCHDPGKGVPDNKCLACHEPIQKAVSGKSGFHGLAGKSCIECHSDHKGRDFVSTTVDAGKFDHSLTGFKLVGEHAKLKCVECHAEKKGKPHFFGNVATCVSCHKKDDPHSFIGKWAQKDCKTCHSETSWKPAAKFDHDKETRYRLDGKHLELKCNSCHANAVYKFPQLEKKNCLTCHQSPHLKTFSPVNLKKKCTECHVTQDWKMQRGNFDHDKSTRFPLTGTHKTIACDQCHLDKQKKQIFRWEATAAQGFCVSCHENVHKTQFSKLAEKSCAECHTTTDFKTRKEFDHATTGFPIGGLHKNLKCAECHVGPPKKGKFHFAELATESCATCHKDPHKGSFGKSCVECHDDRGWKITRDFHKNFTLTGVHYTLQCAECHRDNRKLTGMSPNCVMCHQKDDIHQGRLPECGDCHRQQFWENPDFKHSLSRFPLRGTHRTLDCLSCHETGVYRGTPNRCIDCHLQEAQSVPFPVHVMPQFQSCTDCHNQFQF